MESRQVVHLTNLSLNDTGFYSCTVRNQYGGAVSTGWVQVLIVHFKPIWIVSRIFQTICPKINSCIKTCANKLYLTCQVVDSLPTPSYLTTTYMAGGVRSAYSFDQYLQSKFYTHLRITWSVSLGGWSCRTGPSVLFSLPLCQVGFYLGFVNGVISRCYISQCTINLLQSQQPTYPK